MKLLLVILGFSLIGVTAYALQPTSTPKESLTVYKCADFAITGDGASPEWARTTWHELTKLDQGGENYRSRFKILYSGKGIYLIFEGSDKTITTKYTNDFDNLFLGDVFEVFFHPDTTVPLYLEYEINQLDRELVLIIPNLKGKINGWIPWHYENERRIVKKVKVTGGNPQAGNTIRAWSAELFFPYAIFSPLSNVPPVSGTTWNANFYRLDYDSGKMIKWSWTPIDRSFHEFEKYRPVRFE